MLLACPAAASEPRVEASEQTATAFPRFAPVDSASEIVLPQPLGPTDAALVRRIFAEQSSGHVALAERDTAKLQNRLLLGAILADRYLGRFHHATPRELEQWLAYYSGEPQAADIRALLTRRLTKGVAVPQVPAPASQAPQAPADPEPEDIDPADRRTARNPLLDGEVARLVLPQDSGAALRLIDRAKGLSRANASLLQTQIARRLFSDNRDEQALTVAADAWRKAPAQQRTGQAAYLAGLAAWRLGRIGLALSYFQDTATAPIGPATVRAAGAFWAAKGELRVHDFVGYLAWLKRAAAERRTLHGLIAREILGWGTGLLLSHETLSTADLDALAALPGAERAFALLQVGQRTRAEAELRRLWPEVATSRALRQSLLVVASSAHLTDLAAQLAGLVQAADGIPHDELRFPVPALHPAGGFVMDPALVYGVARTESNFDAKAVSPAGALGLMQLMPVTARSVAEGAPAQRSALENPAINLGLGQRVILSLADQSVIGGNLLGLLASYNAGLTSYARWAPEIRDSGDPLLFIEAIPLAETRAFVERALTYTWIYAARLGLPAPTLDEIAAGRYPSFTPQRPRTTLTAWAR